MKLTSSPEMNRSTRMRSPAEPKTRSSKNSFSARSASSASCATTTPLPPARPSALKTHGRPYDLSARSASPRVWRSEEHTSELQSLRHLVCRLLLEKKDEKGGQAAAVTTRHRGAQRRVRAPGG